MPTLNTTFKQVFGEGLSLHGFVKIKGRYPYFVRLIGEEILHIITYISRNSSEFCILGGVATVYRPRLSLDESPRVNQNWLEYMPSFYEKSNSSSFNEDYCRNLFKFCSHSDDVMNDIVKCALKKTEEIILTVLDKVIDLDSCIEYFHNYKSLMSLSSDVEDFNKYFGNVDYNEGIIYLKADTPDNFKERAESSLIKIHKYNKKVRTDVFTNPDLYAKVLITLERCKVENIKILRSYGLRTGIHKYS
jgi:hypothetical protein